jgi:hypothetical protein
VCRSLLVSPQAVVTQNAPLNMLLSRRISRLVDGYSSLTPDQRDRVDELISSLRAPE